MNENGTLIYPIAHIRTDFGTKFGVPRQSGLVDELEAKIIFEPQFRTPDAVRELENFSHVWLIWGFSQVQNGKWSPTVRPPRLGGNKRIGVFATRSPFRPNSLGLSSVRLKKIEIHHSLGPVITVCGADLVDMTPIYDIKPYLPFTDSHPNAVGGYADKNATHKIDVKIGDDILQRFPKEKRAALIGILSQDPRPSYQNDPERIYGVEFAGMDVKFKVDNNVLTVCGVSVKVKNE